jgi:3-isopropylmalate/(R)-2-methylmalate dehydratase large subunit
MSKTLFDKIWDQHVIAELAGGYQLIHIDRHLLHDLSGPGSLRAIEKRGLNVRNPDLSWATPDHCVSTASPRTDESTEAGALLIPVLRSRCIAEGIELFDVNAPEQGIVHVIGPESGLSLPGATIVCGDSHTCTHGGLGALAWGIGSSELNHVLATQTVIERRPKTLRVNFQGKVSESVFAKDMILALIGKFGAEPGVGYAVEYAGPVIEAMSIEERLTICNLSIEMGAKMGQIAPDSVTFNYLAGRQYAPAGEDWDRAIASWTTLKSDPDAVFDKEMTLDVTHLAPQITWGISPAHTIPVDGRIPDPSQEANNGVRVGLENALEYMDLAPGMPVLGLPVERVFIGSCTNSRLSDLQSAARLIGDQKVAPGTIAWVVPGSQRVKREAEALGLHQIFKDAGFEWREPGCSMCVATNGEFVEPGVRCVSTSNRNFVGRQGPGARTHLASPATAVACAIKGRITDPRTLRIARKE